MAFVQVIDYETSNRDAVDRVHDEWKKATAGKRNAKRVLRGKYHDDPNRFCDIVFFDSYEDAMRNSDLPETQEFAKKLQSAVDGEPQYWNLDITEEEKL